MAGFVKEVVFATAEDKENEVENTVKLPFSSGFGGFISDKTKPFENSGLGFLDKTEENKEERP
jgi:hypothetical protein